MTSTDTATQASGYQDFDEAVRAAKKQGLGPGDVYRENETWMFGATPVQSAKLEITFHPLCEGEHQLFPSMEGQGDSEKSRELYAKRFAELVEDIKTRGLREPITILINGQIIDGRNRWRACQEAGVEPRFAILHKGVYQTTHIDNFQINPDAPAEELPSEHEIVDYMLSMNLHRRHLTAAQRAFIAAERYDLKVRRENIGGDRRSENFIENIFNENKSIESVAELAKVSGPTMRDAAKVVEKGSQELKDAVRSGNVSLHEAAKVADKPPEEQKTVIETGTKRGRPAGSKNKPKEEAEDTEAAADGAKAAPATLKMGSPESMRANWELATKKTQAWFACEIMKLHDVGSIEALEEHWAAANKKTRTDFMDARNYGPLPMDDLTEKDRFGRDRPKPGSRLKADKPKSGKKK